MKPSTYATAFNRAVDEANDSGRTMQLRSQKSYGDTSYEVTFAVGEGRRFGVDAEGEFVRPGTPKMYEPPVITWHKITVAIDRWARGEAKTDPPDGWLLDLAMAYRAMIQAEEAAR
jgi:hypothetical protein